MSYRPARRPVEPARGAQRALRIGRPAPGSHRDFDPLALAGEDHRVLADDVAAPDRVEGDLPRPALAGDPLAAMHGDRLEVAAERGGDRLAEPERGAGGRVDLVAVMRLDDLDVVAVAEDARRDLGELERHVDPDREIGRHRDWNRARGSRDARLLVGSEAGGADHRALARGNARVHVRERALRGGEIHQAVGRSHRGRDVRGQGHAAGRPQRLAGVLAELRMPRRLERRAEREVARLQHAFDERPPHPAGRAGDHELHLPSPDALEPRAGITSPSSRTSLSPSKKTDTRRSSTCVEFCRWRRYT